MDRVAATTGHRDRDEIELSLVQLLLQFLQADTVTLFKLVNDGAGGGAIHCIAANANRGSVEIIRSAATTYLLREHAAWQRCVDTGQPQRLPRMPGTFETLFAVPDENDEIAGVLQVFSQRSPDERDLHLVGGVLRIVRNHMALIDYGQRDTLTGLLNRKTFETQFEKLRRDLRPESGADGKACWIGLADVDHFKSVNDRHGHVFGDEVLLLVSQIIQRSFRGNDRVYRFGGEEFVVLLRECPERATAGALERLRAAVERHRFPQVDKITVSIGWTKIRSQDAPADAIGRADAALYHAKGSGRNQVFQHERLIADGRLTPDAQRQPAEIELF